MRLTIKLKPTVKIEKKLSIKVKFIAFFLLFIPFLLILFTIYQGFKNDTEIKKIEEGITKVNIQKKKVNKSITNFSKQLKNDYKLLRVIEDFTDNSFWIKNKWSTLIDLMNEGLKCKALKKVDLEYVIGDEKKYFLKWGMILQHGSQSELNEMIRYMSDNFGNNEFKILSHTLDAFDKRKPSLLEIKLSGTKELFKKQMEGN